MAITPLHYLVYKVLPLVYDDSLSYYEVVSKVAAKCNELITQVNANTDAISGLTTTLDDTIREIATSIIEETLTPEYIAGIISSDYLDSWLAGNTEFTGLADRVTEAEGDIDIINTTLTSQGEDISANTGNITDLQASQGTQDTAIAANASAITALQGSQTTQDGKISALESADTAMGGRITTLEGSQATQDGKISTLEGFVTRAGKFQMSTPTITPVNGITISYARMIVTPYLTVVKFRASHDATSLGSNPAITTETNIPYRNGAQIQTGIMTEAGSSDYPIITGGGNIQIGGYFPANTVRDFMFVYPTTCCDRNVPNWDNL